MKIAFDTQILFWYVQGKSTYMYEKILEMSLTHDIFLLSSVVREYNDLIFKKNKFCDTKKKWKDNVAGIEKILASNKVFKPVLVECTENDILYKTRDPKDDAILNQAIKNKIDILLTYDKDLLEFKTNKIRICKFSDINMIY